MTRSEFRSSVIRILKTRTGPVGRALIRGCRSLLCTARPYFSRPEIAVPVPDVQSRACAVLLSKADRAGGPRVPSERRFRVLFVVRPGPSDANSTRFRGFNVMEALRLTGVETDHLDDRRIPELLEEILLFDLVVLVRRRMSPEIHQLLEFAEKSAIPVICDLDDYLFDEEVIPCSDFLMGMPLEQAREMIHQFRELVLRAGYYTGATDLLRERAALLGKPSYRIPNGFNQAQIDLSRLAIEAAQQERDTQRVRIGYFSGTPTHQSDFRMVAPVLVRLLREFSHLTLTVTGVDLQPFPEFAEFAGRVEKRRWVGSGYPRKLRGWTSTSFRS